MNQRTQKKQPQLKLNRETLRKLEDRTLKEVAGGAEITYGYPSCGCGPRPSQLCGSRRCQQ